VVAKDLRLVILSQRRVVAILVVLLFVVAGLVVGATQNRPPTGKRDGPPTGAIPVPVVLLLGLAGPAVAVVAIHDTNQREAARLEHERETNLRDERWEAYLAYMAVCDRLHGGDHSPEARAELRKIVEVVELVSLSREVPLHLVVLDGYAGERIIPCPAYTADVCLPLA
jgi:hypothetical protein